MVPLIEENRERLAELCRTYGVRKLEVFGSAADGSFDPLRSDVDFLYELYSAAGGSRLERFLNFADALKSLLGRKIDLVPDREFANPYFRQAVNASRQVVYAA